VTAPARLRTLVLLPLVLDVAGAAPLVRRATRDPRRESNLVEGVPTDLWRPGRDRPAPAWVFVNGAHPLRRREPVVERLAESLARAGYLAAMPDVPGLGEGVLTSRSLEATVAVARAVADRPDVARGRVALIGASTGAGLAVLAAARPELRERVSVVAAVAPFADLRKLLCLTTTRDYDDGGTFSRHDVTDLHRWIVARSLVAALPDEADRTSLVAELERIEAEELDPLDELPRRGDGTSGDGQALLALLGNRDSAQFGQLYDAVPTSVHALVEALSPIRTAPRVTAPVEIVAPPTDAYFPPGEARALAAALPAGRLTVTPTLDHTRPTLSRETFAGFRAFDGFVVRGLRAAAS
jgi:pimeloyl-ACP methyl ester carboxylesterase